MSELTNIYPLRERTPACKQVTNKCELSKAESMLAYFAQGKRLHRFSAERLGDHCLPSTISGLQRKHGILFSRDWMEVPNRYRGRTSVKEYFLQDENLRKAKAIVARRVRDEAN